MNLVDRANRQRSLTATSRTLRSGRIAANAGVLTTTYSYDANGNLIQAGGWNYVWDYLNRMLASGYNNSTTTYAYDPSGARVLQTSTTSTTYYPNKYYSLTSTKAGSNTYATSTNYIWNGDTLLATIDQRLYNGAATGSAIYRYIHPDHLGSTNAVTDQNGSLVQLMDYYPYGATRIATSTYPTNEKRQYIGQLYDQGSGLNYLNARYYDGQRGQFLSQEPILLNLGDAYQVRQLAQKDQQTLLSDPQLLNAYGYSRGNPISYKDTNGKNPLLVAGAIAGAIYGVVKQEIYDYYSGQVTSVPGYVNASLKGSVQGTVAAGSIIVLGAPTILEINGAYQTGTDVGNFVNTLHTKDSAFEQKQQAFGFVILDALQYVAGLKTPAKTQQGYDAIYTLLQIAQQWAGASSPQGNTAPSSKSSATAGSTSNGQQSGQSSGSSGGGSSAPASGGGSLPGWIGYFNPFLPH